MNPSIQNERKDGAVNDEKRTERQGVTLRAILIGGIYLIFLAVLVPFAEFTELRQTIESSILPAPSGVILIIGLLIVNMALKKLKLEDKAFTQGELITIYVMVTVGGLTLSRGLIAHLPHQIMGFGGLTYVTDNALAAKIWPQFSSIIMPRSQDAINGYWLGLHRTGLSSIPWAEWVMPIILWVLFYSTIIFVQICIAVLFRKHWTDIEHISYPLTRPIKQMVETPDGNSPGLETPFWQSKTMWLGMGVSIFLSALLYANRINPGVPAFPTQIKAYEFFPREGIWSVMRAYVPFEMRFNVLVAAVATLMPTDTSFAIWFTSTIGHYGVKMGQEQLGIRLLPGHRLFHFFTTFGAQTGLAIFLLWIVRGEIKAFWNRDETNEGLSGRTALLGIIIGTIFMVLWASLLMKIDFTWALVYILGMYAAAVAVARIRGLTGVPSYKGTPLINAIATTFDRSNIGAENLGKLAATFRTIDTGSTTSYMALILESYKLGDSVNVKRKQISKLIIGVFIFAALIGLYSSINVMYTYGAVNTEQFLRTRIISKGAGIDHFMEDPQFEGGSRGAIFWAGVGLLITAFLSFMKSRFVWWPYCPVGFTLAQSTWTLQMWPNFFIAWLYKVLVFRYGGAGLYRRFEPFFLGMIIGYAVSSAMGAIFDLPPGWIWV